MPEQERVVAAVIVRNGKYLVCQRPRQKRHGGLWEFPGGKLLSDESLFDAAYRELGEELDVTVVSVGQVRAAVPDEGSPFVIEFVDAQIEGDPTPHEHEAVAWCTAHELMRMPLAPSDRQFAGRVLSAAG